MGDKSHPPFTVEMTITEKPLMFEVDMGATVTILSQEVYQQLFPSLKLYPSLMLLKSYTGDQVKVLGEVQVDVSYGEQKDKYTLYVVKGNNSCLLGRKKYDMVFKEDLGTLQSGVATLHIKPNATPKFLSPAQYLMQ